MGLVYILVKKGPYSIDEKGSTMCVSQFNVLHNII